MHILLGIIVAAVVGVAVHFALPGKTRRGVVLAPAIATAVGAVAWTVLTWLGLGPDNPLIWLSALAVPAVLTVPAIVLIDAARTRHDAAERERLRIG